MQNFTYGNGPNLSESRKMSQLDKKRIHKFYWLILLVIMINDNDDDDEGNAKKIVMQIKF